MKKLAFLILLSFSILFSQEKNLSMRPFIDNPGDYTYSRGIYLIILGASSFESLLSPPLPGGDFIKFKQSQGYTLDIKNYNDIASSKEQLKDYLQTYSVDNPQLEYVLFIGDVDGAFSIPSFEIPSYNEPGQDDVTDYEYTYSNESSMYEPHFFIGRWPIQASSDVLNIKARTIQYSLMDSISDKSFLDNSLIVAGNYKTADGAEVEPQYWPVTPRWTSLWIQDRLENELSLNADTVFFSQENPVVNNPAIANIWNDGVGLVNYRGWGNATGWIKPEFKRENIDELTNGWKLPIVFSYVCNTGDFGNDTYQTGFGEKLLLTGSFSSPKGAAAMIGPSDLDTDTRFNNVMTGGMWDGFLEYRVSELAQLLHAGKQSVGSEFIDFTIPSVNGDDMSIPKFYHHIYNILGDPSIPVWLGEPGELMSSLESNSEITESFVSLLVSDVGGSLLQDVVGAILNSDGDLIGKGLSNQYGELNIEFTGQSNGSEIELYLNAPQFMQKKIDLTVVGNNGADIPTDNYTYSSYIMDYTEYSMISSTDSSPQAPVYNWIEINETGTNLNLTDDSQTTIDIGFNFKYFDQTYSQISVCSNGWVSFEYLPIDHFWNFSIPFPMGPDGMIAPFMDDLDDNVGAEELNVYSYHDEINNQFVIEWDDVINGEDDDECGTGQGCTRETFQLILKNGNGLNGDIIFQYKEINDIDANGNYSTIGIESPDHNFGYQYQFRNMTDAAQLVQDEMAILFTTSSIISGCTDPDACNYSQYANYDDNSCEFESDCLGECGGTAILDDCGACNGGNSANIGCGCYLPAALDYCEDTDGDSLGAGDIVTFCLADIPSDGNFVIDCSDPEPDCFTNDTDDCGVCNGDASSCTGCQNLAACNVGSVDECIFSTDLDACATCSGETDGTGIIVDNDTDDDGVCDTDEVVGCQDPTACNYNSLATDASDCFIPTSCDTCDEGAVVFDGALDGVCESCLDGIIVNNDSDGDTVCDTDEVVGCQNPIACNYNESATDVDDCDFISCASYPTELSSEEWSGVSVNKYDETCMGNPTSTPGPFNFGETTCESKTFTLDDNTEHSFALTCDTLSVTGNWVVYNESILCFMIGEEEDCTSYTYDDNDTNNTLELITANDGENCYETVFQLTSTLAIDEFGIPTDFFIYQNYPNPFNPSTTINFEVATPTNVSLVIYDLMGKEVYSLASGYHVPGIYSVVWNANDSNGEQVSSGMYIYQLRILNTVLTKKLVLLR
jgi:hypothetical protein